MAQEPSDKTRVDVVIPVYGNRHVVGRCLESVLRFRSAAVARVLVVDDGSPDRETTGYLESLHARRAIDLIRHDRNLGFVACANEGLRASDRDVILLNSDTEVHGNWVERLVRCAEGAPDVGTVTPFSNNATICSYPFPPWRRVLPGGLTVTELDALFARANAGQSADLPTGVGFCLLIRRACLTAVGLFDEARFGRGYGEETDFCQRARRAGWRSMIAADVFVYHGARGSFGADGHRRARSAEQVLRSMYPGYARAIRDFILADSLGGFRRRVDAARVSASLGQALAVHAERIVEKVARLAVAIQIRA